MVFVLVVVRDERRHQDGLRSMLSRGTQQRVVQSASRLQHNSHTRQQPQPISKRSQRMQGKHACTGGTTTRNGCCAHYMYSELVAAHLRSHHQAEAIACCVHVPLWLGPG